MGDNFAEVPQTKLLMLAPGSHAYIRLRSIKQTATINCCQFEDPITSVTSKCSLVAVLILTMCCIALPTYRYDSATTYSARVLNTSQEECPSVMQRETIIAEVKEDIRNTLLQIQTRKY